MHRIQGYKGLNCLQKKSYDISSHFAKRQTCSQSGPTFSRLAPFVRAGLHYKAISAQKRDTCGKTGRESKYKHDVNTFFRGGGQGCKNICSLKYDKTREGKLRMKNVHISPPTGYMSVDVIRRSALGSN